MYILYYVPCDTQLLIFRFSGLCITDVELYEDMINIVNNYDTLL